VRHETVFRVSPPRVPKLPTDSKQDLRPNLNFAVFHRGERVRLIPISVKPFLPAGNKPQRAAPGRWS
jgi:hypothetical protein